MAEVEMNEYTTKGDQSDSLPAPRPVEAQPVGNIPTSVLNPQPGQPPQSQSLYGQQPSGSQHQFVPQHGNASYTQPPPGYAPHTQPPPGYAPHTQHPPGYAHHTQPPPGYAPHTQPPPGYAHHGYFTQNINVNHISHNQVAPATQPVFATPSSGVAPAQAPAPAPAYGPVTGQQAVTQFHSAVSLNLSLFLYLIVKYSAGMKSNPMAYSIYN